VVKIGVIALQGDVSEHIAAMRRAMSGGEVLAIRKPGLISRCDALVLPGGESTTISRQLTSSGLTDELHEAAKSGVPILATCAGLVLVSRKIGGDSRVRPLGLMDMRIDRNAFGSQRESFEADLQVEGFESPYRAVFIRAPAIAEVGRGVRVLARIDNHIVGAQQKNLLALAFHPELTEDDRFHRIILNMLEA